MSARIDDRDEPGGPLFWLSAAAGLGIVVVALARFREQASARSLASAARFVVGAGVAHDAIWAPMVVLVGAATWLVPSVARLPVRLGLAFTGLTVLFSWPEVRRYGARPRNPSILPLDYGRNLVIVVAGIWLAVGVGIVIRALRQRAAT